MSASPSAESRLWHGLADMSSVKHSKRVIARGEGVYLWDETGHNVLDLPGSLWYCNGTRQRPDETTPQHYSTGHLNSALGLRDSSTLPQARSTAATMGTVRRRSAAAGATPVI